MWGIIRLSCWFIRVDPCLDDEENMIQRMKSTRYIFRRTCASWLPIVRTSGSELVWVLGFKIGFPVGMMLVARVGSPFGHLAITLSHVKDLF